MTANALIECKPRNTFYRMVLKVILEPFTLHMSTSYVIQQCYSAFAEVAGIGQLQLRGGGMTESDGCIYFIGN